MKGSFFSRICLILYLIITTTASIQAQYFDPADFIEDGIAYKILEDSTSVGVYVKSTWAGFGGINNYTMQTVTIPSLVFSSKHNKEFVVKQINSEALINSIENVKNITIPETIESIGDYAFHNTGLERIYHQDHGGWISFVSARDNMFFFNAKRCEIIGKNCFTLSTTLQPDYNTTENWIVYDFFRIGKEVVFLPAKLPEFYMNGKNLFIPDNVEVIANSALDGNLDVIVFGKGIKYIGDQKLFNPGHHGCIYFTSPTPPTECHDTFYGFVETVYVPVGSLEAYQSSQSSLRFITNKMVEKDYIAVQSLDFGYDKISIYQGESLHLAPTPYPLNSTAFEDGSEGVTKMVAQDSNNPDHIIHLVNDTFEGTQVGEFDITAYVDTVIAKCHVTVLPEYQGNVQCVKIQLNGCDLEEKVIEEGESLTLDALIYPTSSKDINKYQEVEWASSNNTIASVSSTGIVMGIAQGECDITVTIRNSDTGNELSDTCHILVDNTNDINDITVDQLPDKYVDVYNMQGQLLKHHALRENATQGLRPGIYILGGKKVIVK